MTRLILSLFLAIATLGSSANAAQVIKLSKSGICHAPGTSWYDRTASFTGYDSLEACLTVGRLPKGESNPDRQDALAALPIASTNEAYDRDRHFGSWIDEDGDCLNTRHEILASLSTGPVQMSPNGCLVRHGRWNDPYTGRIFTEAKQVDIDHMVPLKWAWDHGASDWTPQQRVAFANDPVNLFVVHAGTNREKGADGPLEWLPPNEAFRCEYMLRFQRIVLTYKLKGSASESERLSALRQNLCGR